MTYTRKYILTYCALLLSCTAGAQSTSDSLALDSMIHSLPEVMVKGERPLAVAHGSAISYDLPRLIANKGVDNVYDAVKELPGVIEQDNAFMLAGRPVTVSLNGTTLTLTTEQLMALLKSLPASRIQKAEVTYTTSAKTQVRGAMVNILLKKEGENGAPLTDEVTLGYNQKHRAMFDERMSAFYHQGKLTMDVMYQLSHGKRYSVTDEAARHSLSDGTIHDISTHESVLTKMTNHNYRIGTTYDFSKEHSLSVTYQGSYQDRDADNGYSGSIAGQTLTTHRTWLHNLKLDYAPPFGMKAGAEATYYHDPEGQTIASVLPTGTLNSTTDNDQRVNTWRFYLSQEHNLRNNWSVNYGAWYKTSINHSRQNYSDASQKYEEYLRQKEDVVNMYGGVSKAFGQELFVEASIAAEYYHSPVWDKWYVFPTLSLTYIPNQNSTWVFGLSTDRKYPDYWTMNNFTVYGNGGYYEITGNPYLKPSTLYQTQLVYIAKHKYQFAAWFNYTDDYFVQTPYQRSDRLAVTFRSLNFNYQQQAGVQAVLPHRFGTRIDSRLTLTGVWMHERCDDYYDIPFNRAIIYGMARMSNTITLCVKPALTMTVDGMIRSKAKQAIYDLPASGNLDIGLRWLFWKKQASLRMFCNDVFETSSINPEINYRGQSMSMNVESFRQFGVSLTVKFGGYKEQKHQEVDTSRFRK